MYAPNSNGIIGDTVRAASPQLAYQIGQEFKRKDQEGSAQHLLAHAILGAAVSYATGNNITTGALSGATSEAVAPALSDFLFNTKDPSELNQEQKDTITSIITLGTASIACGAMGDVSVAVNASEVGKGSAENNDQSLFNLGQFTNSIIQPIDYSMNMHCASQGNYEKCMKKLKSTPPAVFSVTAGGDLAIGKGKGANSSAYLSSDEDGVSIGLGRTQTNVVGFGASLGVGFDYYKGMDNYKGKSKTEELCKIIVCVRTHTNPDTKENIGWGVSPLLEPGSGFTHSEGETELYHDPVFLKKR